VRKLTGGTGAPIGALLTITPDTTPKPKLMV